MNEKQLAELLEAGKELNARIDFYLEHKTLARQFVNEQEIKGHIEKAEHNLNFVKDTLEKGYSDWAIVGCYYAIYHIAIALILRKGYCSKNHDATLCILIKEYYNTEITEDDIKLLNRVYLDNQDVLFYVKSKEQREKASYSTQILFNKKSVDDLKQKTLLFVRKGHEILKRI